MDAVLEPISIPTDLPDKPKRRKLTLQDTKAIATLVSRRKLNESEACHVLGILPAQWQVFKCRHKVSAIFESIIERTRGATINHAIERLEHAGEDEEITLPNGKVITKRGDWRADAARLPLLDPARFGQQQAQQPASTTFVLSVDTMRAIEARLVAQLASAGQTQPAIDMPAVKAIAETSEGGKVD